MRISAIAVVVVGLLGGLASAQPAPDKAAALVAFTEGQQRYAAGEYLPAAMKFEAAYGFDPDPVYLFNVAQAYRFGNGCAKAVTFYNRFLEAVPNAPNAGNVKQYLEQAEACAKTSSTLDPGSLRPPPTEPVVVNLPIADRPASEDPGRTKRWFGIGAMFVGGAAIGAGIYYGTEASRLTDLRAEKRDECVITTCGPGYGDEIDREGRRAQTVAWILIPVGGVAVIGGVALYLLNRGTERASVAVVPTPDGAVAVGSFRF